MTRAKVGLGRSLSSLLPVEDIYDAGTPGFFICPIEKISRNPDQPRKDLDNSSLKMLADSIKEKGVLQPIVVRKTEEDQYEIIAGERRWRAAQMAGLTSVPVVIKDVSPEEVLELALIENIQRLDLNPIEEALAYKRLAEEHGLTQSEIAKQVGRDRSTVSNFLRLLKLPRHIQDDISSGNISPGHARALLSLPTTDLMDVLTQKIKKDGLSVRQAEEFAKRLLNNRINKKSYQKDEEVESIASDLSHALNAKVKISYGKRSAKLEIRAKNKQHLKQIIKLMQTSTK